MFYLEKRDELTGTGPYLKYGKKGKAVSNVIDLGASNDLNQQDSTFIVKNNDQGSKFKIITFSG